MKALSKILESKILEGLSHIKEAKNPNEFIISCSGGNAIRFPKKKVDVSSTTFEYIINTIARDVIAWNKPITIQVYDKIDTNTLKEVCIKALKKATYMNTENNLSVEDIAKVSKLIKLMVGNDIVGYLG